MKLGMEIAYLFKQFGTKDKRSLAESCKLMKEAGFDYADYTPNLLNDNWEKETVEAIKLFDHYGITVNQTHALFNRYGGYDSYDFNELTRRAFVATKMLNAKYVVVHADEYRTTDHYDENEILEYEYQRLSEHVDFSIQNGFTVAIENLFEDTSKNRPKIDGKSRFTSRIEELEAILKRFDSPNVKCCWDFGHAHCAFGNNQLEMMKRIGKNIVCTHVHDNYYEKDLHLPPFFGQIDWEGHMKALKEFGYQGVLSYEFVYGCFPDDILKEYLRLAKCSADKLSSWFDQ